MPYQLLSVTINNEQHYAVSDGVSDEIVQFGPGPSGLRAAVEFLNRIWLAQHAAEMAGWAH